MCVIRETSRKSSIVLLNIFCSISRAFPIDAMKNAIESYSVLTDISLWLNVHLPQSSVLFDSFVFFGFTWNTSAVRAVFYSSNTVLFHKEHRDVLES